VFTQSIEIASGFTSPYVGLRRRADGEVFTTIGAFVVLDADGWVLTAGHVVDEILAAQTGNEMAGDAGEGGGGVTAHTELWAVPGFMSTRPRLVEAQVNRVADIGVCRLEPFDPEAICAVPVLRDTLRAPIEQGMSVCRLGFPFCDVPATYDTDRDEFTFDERAFPVPRFALDGIVARFNRRFGDDGTTSALYIETSTPGLRGQSGGPLLDTAGRVCGVQSHTAHIDLGFDARYPTDVGTVTERQFLNVGTATHVDEVRAMLDAVGVKYRLG
jgi:hypothetical protein